jgi:hypothetical protein
MRRSNHDRPSAGRGPGRRAAVAIVTLAAFGGLVGISQAALAQTNTPSPGAAEGSAAPSEAAPSSAAPSSAAPGDAPPSSAAPTASPGGLQILGNNCDNSDLEAHTGFQDGNRCVSTAFGEVGDAANNPTLLIAEAPRRVTAGEQFQLEVSTRNLVRDRFLPAARGGYYVESSLLTDEGLVRGHFHTACRILDSTDAAVDPSPVPAFFVATEDGGGGADSDTVTITVPGLPEGVAQCASWAGDGSHRIPMMARANQIPAIDSVRIEVQPAEEPPASEPPAEEPPASEPPVEEPPASEPPAEEPPAEEPGGEQPPAEQPDDEEPPAEQPDDEQPPAEQPDDEKPPAEQPDDEQPPAAEAPAPDQSTGAPAPPADDLATLDPVANADNGDDDGGNLAFTGVNTFVIGGAGVALLIAGVVILLMTRRRQYRPGRN